jgi:hypothetical protein
VKWAYAFAAPYGDRGATGVDSCCGAVAAFPNISDDDAWYRRMSGSTIRTASSRRVTPSAVTSPVRTGCAKLAAT